MPIEPDRFRAALAHVPTSVVIVTADTPDGPTGMTIGSFASVSLDPCLVGFFPGRSSSSWPAIRDAGRFAVNVLAADQDELCRAFARPGDRFEGVAWAPSAEGNPILDGDVLWIDCVLHDELDAGDHTLVLGEVVDLGEPADRDPLVFHRGTYTTATSQPATSPGGSP